MVIALKAVGIQPGDEVIVPSYTFVATGNMSLRSTNMSTTSSFPSIPLLWLIHLLLIPIVLSLASSVLMAQAVPIFVDVDPNTYNMDIVSISLYLSIYLILSILSL